MTDATPATKDIIIQGETFPISVPYAEGHPLTAVEARVLNQTYCENIRNNMAGAIKKAKEEDKYDAKAMAKTVADYDAAYTFATGGGAVRRTIDPIEKEARSIARNLITSQLKAAGKKMKDQAKDKVQALIAKWAEHPKVLAAAKKVVKEREELAYLSLADA